MIFTSWVVGYDEIHSVVLGNAGPAAAQSLSAQQRGGALAVTAGLSAIINTGVCYFKDFFTGLLYC